MTEKQIIIEGLKLLAFKYTSDAAQVLLAAIAYQESGFKHRRQIKGPARGLWQFERGGGVVGVMTHKASKAAAMEVCQFRNVQWDSNAIYNALEHDDLLACAFARLLLFTHPRSLPTDEDRAWLYYLDLWRPGKPHPERWAANWEKAINLWK